MSPKTSVYCKDFLINSIILIHESDQGWCCSYVLITMPNSARSCSNQWKVFDYTIETCVEAKSMPYNWVATPKSRHGMSKTDAQETSH